jgi:hypothetical protein
MTGLAPKANVIDFIPTDNGQLNVVDHILLPPLCLSQTAALGGAPWAGILGALNATGLTETADTTANVTMSVFSCYF